LLLFSNFYYKFIFSYNNLFFAIKSDILIIMKIDKDL